MIAKRPDIQAAESRLRAALAGYDASRLQFYPALSLDASLNAGSQIFSQWFSDPIRSIGGALTLPFIQWNTQQLTVKQADLAVKQAAITFRSTAYDALAEVDEAMENRLSADEQRARLHQSLALSQRRLTDGKPLSRGRRGFSNVVGRAGRSVDVGELPRTNPIRLPLRHVAALAGARGGETQYRMMQHEAE